MDEHFTWPLTVGNNAIGPDKDYPPSPGDEHDDQQPRQGWYVNQPRPTALREILMYVRNVRQQLEYVEAAVRRMENL